MANSPLKRRRSPSVPEVSSLDMWKWTLTNDAIAPCFVQDVLLMRECQPQKDVDYFWLGRVPCRTAMIAGIVVGVNVFEKRTVYTGTARLLLVVWHSLVKVDDGTGVVDCSHRAVGPRAPNPSVKPSASSQKLKLKHPPSQVTKDIPNPSYSLFAFKPLCSTNTTDDPFINVPPTLAKYQPATLPKRISVGAFVRVHGRVSKLHRGRQIVVQDIEAVSANHEILHRNTVRMLHRTRYNPSLGPFIPPIVDAATPSKLPTTPTRPRFPNRTADADASPSTPKQKSRQRQTPVKSNATESSYLSGTECSESEYSECSPRKTQKMPVASLKLRHPSRAHSRDLTANTFKIYLKYYMDELDNISHSAFFQDVNTLRKHAVLPPTWGEETPRPSKIQPRTMLAQDRRSNPNGDFTKKGFTMSFLRRIPELAFLARRVVEAEAKRRAKEERGKTRSAKTAGSTGIRPNGDRGVSQSTSASSAPTQYRTAKLTRQGSQDKENAVQDRGRDPRVREAATCPKDMALKDNPGPKMKRLFTFAIRKLYDEGSIVLWDGPTHPYASKYGFIPPNDRLWKVSSKSAASTQMLSDSLSLSATFSTTRDSASMSCSAIPDMDLCLREIEGELSDPGEDEEAYIPLTPTYLAPLVEEAIEVLMSRTKSANTANGNTRREPTIHCHPGPTQAQITSFLQRKDSRWAKIGEWWVHEALTLLQDTGKIWPVSGRGTETRWEKCL
ncbi:hypothetical protein PC9H_008689 [Pleurotus ostreatus]|uniref:CST complex subunit STN1 n=1 Tax=Pleurotus ostreatus TaxID=5322 RepID=A0A8H6ZT43_PLEOS|nr:uncharacterized protein PC9H_008689 [Pleurotus ostreatus]KAF7426321.1 hypothetical protein PC9H_008689 [Pleurotus ostreatus]